MWSIAEAPRKYYLPLWKLLGCHAWPHLRSLRLDGLLACEAGLMDLLMRHRSLLKLQLCNIGVFHGSYKSLLSRILSRIRSVLTLQDFQIWGFLIAFHPPDENWLLPPLLAPATNRYPGMTYYSEWENKTYDRDQLRRPRLKAASEIRDFVLRGGQWPIATTDNLLGPPGGDRFTKCGGKGCDSIDAINKRWDELAEQDDLEAWETSEYDFDTDFGVEDVEDVMQIFDNEGFDDSGFDRNGLNSEGMYFERVASIKDVMGGAEQRMVMERIMVENIKQGMNSLFWEEKFTAVQAEFEALDT